MNPTISTLLKIICLTFLLSFLSGDTSATTYAPIYPYTQKTEGGKVKSHSVPYGVNDGGRGPGETFVYSNGKLLYSIDKYFSSPYLTINNGQYLIEYDFSLNYRELVKGKDSFDKETINSIAYNSKAVTIYKEGILFKTIEFTQMGIDTSTVEIHRYSNWFTWEYNNEISTDRLKRKMVRHPAFIEHQNLNLITSDNQLIIIDIAKGLIVSRNNAYETLAKKSNWAPRRIKRKYRKVKYPDKFLLPKLLSGKTIEQGLADFLDKMISEEDNANAVIQIYFHTLLINKKGKCETVYAATSTKINSRDDDYKDNPDLKIRIENWIKEQTFKIDTFPRGFGKFKYTDFVWLN